MRSICLIALCYCTIACCALHKKSAYDEWYSTHHITTNSYYRLYSGNGFIILDIHNLYCQIHNFELDFAEIINL